MGDVLEACAVVLTVLDLGLLALGFGTVLPTEPLDEGAGVTHGLELLCDVTLKAGEAAG